MSRLEDMKVLRLASVREGNGQAFLASHHLAAADRLERLIARARLAPRVTMSYDAARAGGGTKGGNGVAEMSDTAAEARQKLNRMATALPPDCWNVVFDVCGMGKGLQVIETERCWPRRSAKLVLRIALDQLAAYFGLSAQAEGRATTATTGWIEARLPLISEQSS